MRVIYGIMVGTQTALFSASSGDLVNRHAEVVQPLFGDLFTSALFHRFLHIVARYVGEQAVNPYTYLIFILLFELSLTVDGPALKATWNPGSLRYRR